MGASAAAVLISAEPRIAELELGRSGYWTEEVSDLTRPTSRVETGNSETSLVSYIEALDNAFSHFLEGTPEAADFESFFQKNIYHAPFGGMTFRAHSALMRRFHKLSRAEMREHFALRTLPSLTYLRRMGGTYSASTFIGLLGLVDHCPDVKAGDRISMFSYGSGCCAEFYSVRLCEGAHEAAGLARVGAALDGRRPLSVAEYEEVESARATLVDRGDYEVPRDGWYDSAYRANRRLVFLGMENYYRQYGWSA
jgi:hydroxymethylglutaryl-CoA synthase